ncbi:protein FAM47A-like [Sphaerodactylus townsendi]|uniref:protein FAM47A-like n=1 Tax=Sphaerodactylus townsendi TaxID=933632 RepID=UPI0020268CAB|nr:protein FAM47A-like [Sphaerodactylus townsendi]
MSPAPWYKERLSSKCFREHSSKKERYSDALNTQRWRFLKSGLDDFRHGCPLISDNIIIRGEKGPLPVILRYKEPDALQTVPYTPRELHSKKDISFSKLTASQKTKRDYIAQTERCLAEHPLVLYPHLEESVSPELFRDVMKYLDTEMYHNRRLLDESKSKGILPTLSYQMEHVIKTDVRRTSTTQDLKPPSRNLYTWPHKKESTAREDASKIDYIPPLDENIKQITKEFCDWVNGMGGEYNIEEATLLKLFDTRYETKPVTTTPIRFVELYHVPAELKQCLGKPPPLKVGKSSVKAPPELKREKMKYGSWYLPPKTWEKQAHREKAAVPDILQKFLNARKYGKKEEKEKQLLYGIYAFEEFLELKGYRKPVFLLQMLPKSPSERMKGGSPLKRFSVHKQRTVDYKRASSSFF